MTAPYFAYDWITPKGVLGNGNPLVALMDPHAFRVDEAGVGYETPFIRTGFSPTHEALGAIDISVAEAIRKDVSFVYEMVPVGLMDRALGQWENRHHRALFQHISDEVKVACRSGKATILINAAFEGDHLISAKVFDHLHQACADDRIPVEHVVFATGNLRAQSLYNRWRKAQPVWVQPIQIVTIPLFESMIRYPLRTSSDKFLSENDARAATNRPKHFLSFNRRAHEHRQIFAAQIVARGLLDRFHLSMSVPAEGRYSPKEMPLAEWQRLFPTIKSDLALLNQRTPITVDADEFKTNHAFTHVVFPYRESYINVVTETQFLDPHDELLFLSEKVYKPMANYQPFIVLGCRHTLKILREQGYATFAPFIDESYDNEPDDYVRMKMVLAEIERISALPMEELDAWYQSIFDETLVKNRNTMLERDTFAELRPYLVPAKPLATHLKRLFGR